MTKKQFREWVSQGIRVLDGATGTELYKQGMPQGAAPEKWVLENPDAILKTQKAYIESGSDIVYTCTLGGNGLKLKEFGIEDVVGCNRELAKLSQKAAAGRAFVAGDMAPTGQMMEPFGTYTFEEIVEVYKKQVQGLLEGGVDLFVIETMMDIQEARAALLAVKESCDLPVIVTMTFEHGGHTLSGTDPLAALVTLQSLGADAVGCNCSTGPREMLEIIRSIKPYAKVPLVAKPNAGIPKLVDGRTVFDMEADEFASYTQEFVRAGVNLIGGCCGTNPEYIRRISVTVKEQKYIEIARKEELILSSSRNTVSIHQSLPACVIGERIQPARDQELREELRTGSMERVTEYAMAQLEEGASILAVNAVVSAVDEAKILTEMVSTLSTIVHAPLCFDSSLPKALEAALRVYPGRALVRLDTANEERLKGILKAAVKYGAAFVFLPDDGGEGDNRIKAIEKVYREAQKLGYSKSEFLPAELFVTIA